MTLKQIECWRTWVGRTAAICCLFLFLFIADALVARFREPRNLVTGWPGATVPVNGMLTEPIASRAELSFHTPAADLRLEFDDLTTGYWLGGNMWNGRLHIGKGIRPGSYPLAVVSGKGARQRSLSWYRVEVFADPAALEKSSASFWVSRLGIHPWPAAGVLAPLIVILFGGVFLLSRGIETRLAQEGKGEIYRIGRDPNGLIAYCTLGKKGGLTPGRPLTLTDAKGEKIGTATVEEVFADHSRVRVSSAQEIRPGTLVSC